LWANTARVRLDFARSMDHFLNGLNVSPGPSELVHQLARARARIAIGEPRLPLEDQTDDLLAYVSEGETFETYRPAYRYGGQAEAQYGQREFDVLEPDLERGWRSQEGQTMPWEQARGAVKDSYERTIQIRRARDVPEVCDDLPED
jgi:hypothetical protein